MHVDPSNTAREAFARDGFHLHREPLLAPDSIKRAVRVSEGEYWEEVEATLPPGGVSFHHHLTLHFSGPNHSGRARRSLALHLRIPRSETLKGECRGLARFIDASAHCPVVYSVHLSESIQFGTTWTKVSDVNQLNCFCIVSRAFR